MIDTHCHVDLYPRPSDIAASADRAGVLTIVVTNLPSAFDRAYPHVSTMKNVRLAVGLHPLLTAQHKDQRERFAELVDSTSYIGEVGLDFSQAGFSTKETQIETFRFVLDTLQGKPKFITLHSRRAESAVLEILEEKERSPVVFHWYSGSLNILDRALALGHFFSINPAMVNNPKGKRIIEALSPDRVLTESDGPFVKINGREVVPSDVAIVEDYLAAAWHMSRFEVSMKIKSNFLTLIRPIQQIKKSSMGYNQSETK